MHNNNEITLEALQQEMQKMRCEYEKEIESLRRAEEKRSSVKGARKSKFAEFLKAQEAWLNEYVEVRLFKDNEKYKDDVYVAINGKNCVIRRGVWTRIRRKFALLLDQSEIQDLRTAELMEREEGRFADESRRRSV